MALLKLKVALESARKLASSVALLVVTVFPPRAVSAQSRSPVAGRDTSAPVAAASSTLATATASLADHPPLIDGRDDDAVWKTATPVTGFRVFDPKEDGDPSFRTEVKFAYDAE